MRDQYLVIAQDSGYNLIYIAEIMHKEKTMRLTRSIAQEQYSVVSYPLWSQVKYCPIVLFNP